MEQMQSPATTYDFRQYDQVWQRVSPALDPYPGVCAPDWGQRPQPVPSAPADPAAPQPMQPVQTVQPAQPVRPVPFTPLQSGTERAEENLPGAQMNPCCMGSAAAEMLEVLQGFIEEELADRRYYLAFARQAPSWARQTLRDTGEEEGEHARRLMAVYYLITGRCYRPAISCERISVGPLCAALRNRYHQEACGGFNYARAADGTTDVCLQKLLNELSQDEYCHAERMLSLLQRALTNAGR